VCRAGGGRRRGGGEGGGRGGWFLHDDRDGDDGRRVVTMGGSGGLGGGRRNPGGLASDWKDAQRATYNAQEDDAPRGGGPRLGGRGGGRGGGGGGGRGGRRDEHDVEGSRRQVTLTQGDSQVRGPSPSPPRGSMAPPCVARWKEEPLARDGSFQR